MPKTTPQGLRGLQGVGSLSKQEYDEFVRRNDGLISRHAYDPEYISNLYSNKMFIDRYGVDQFKALPDFNMRNNLLRNDVVNEEWDNLYGGMDDVWKQKYNVLSTDYKLKVLESDWLTPKEFEENWKKKENAALDIDEKTAFIRPAGSTVYTHPTSSITYGEAAKQVATEKNDRILEHIYNDAVDERAKGLEGEVAEVHLSPEITQLNDEQVDEWFKRAVVPGSYTDRYGRLNAGIPEFAKFYVENEDGGEDMREMSIDDKRKVLAMKKVYEENMDSEMARTALNNYAMRYNKEHQSSWDKLGRFGKDVLISAVSYSADKINSIYNLGLAAADGLSELGVLDKPEVWVDDQGNIIDENTSAITNDSKGRLVHIGEDGQTHYVHKEQIDRRTLHNMGKNLGVFDALGSEDNSWLNPQDWNNREAMGVWSKDLAKEYQKLGASPYKVVYEPNDDSDLVYESFKMMSFGLADGAAQFIPFGIGQVGKVLSTADKVGRATRALGKAMDWSGKMLTAQSRFGSTVQGLAGAGGIAYAYQRGSFGETLQQNLANAEETALNRSRQEIFNLYQNDEQYKVQMDALIDAKAASMKSEYIANLGRDGQNRIVNESTLDEMIRARAQETVMGEAVQDKLKEYKASDEYAQLQKQAISHAGDAAWTTFWPEAIKYSLVNTFGHRQWLYKNPTGVTNKVSASLKGLREITTPTGRQRLATETSKFLTNGQKWKQFGKAVGSQVWGGAWTNGTDDMMVDAAERINTDSFDRYLHAFENGEALADTYGFADGLYSYWKGLNNSLGQETTWNAATVGGLGSILSFTPNMANIAHLATKEGRQAYKNNFQQRYKRNEDGSVMRDEQGNPQYEDISWRENWRDRANYFIQNGVLNTYYGAKQNERDLQQHADYVNMLLDDYDDFRVIQDLVTSDIALSNAETVGDQKTLRHVKAINAINALNQLGNNKNDPATLSSVVQNAKEFIAKAAEMQMEGENAFTEDEVNNMLGQYYASNPGVPQSEANNQMALYQISQNAQKLQEASEAMDRAEEQIVKIERSTGKKIDPAVRAKLKMNQALDSHWRERVQQMQQELNDHAAIDGEVSQENLIPSVGGKKNVEALVKVYDKQQAEIQKELEEQRGKTQDLKEKLDTAIANRKVAKTSEERYTTQKAQEEAQAKYDDALQQENYLKDLKARTDGKKKAIETALAEHATDEGGNPQEKVLTSDEIFGLDAVTRARMMNPENRQLYSEQQQREISKLEQRLLMRDGDALSKVQDIARLSQRIAANEDAYSRMVQNPEAAAVQLEAQRAQEADTAYRLINQRNAEAIASFVEEFDQGMKGHDEISQETKDQFVFRTLRKMSPILLDIIEKDNLLPQYYQQIQDAKEWGKIVSDIKAVIDHAEESQAWKDNVSRAIDGVVENAMNREDIITNLEKAIDDTDGSQTAQDFEKVLNALEQLGYQRDATTIENRKQRRERETAEAQRKKEAEEDAQIAAAEAQAKAQEAANAQPAQDVKPDGSNLGNPWEVGPIDQGEGTAEQRGKLSDEVVSFDDEGNPIIEQANIAKKAQINTTKYLYGNPVRFISSADDIQSLSSLGLGEEFVTSLLDDFNTPNILGRYLPETGEVYLFVNNISKLGVKDNVVDGVVYHENVHALSDGRYSAEDFARTADLIKEVDEDFYNDIQQKHKNHVKEVLDEEVVAYYLENIARNGDIETLLEGRINLSNEELEKRLAAIVTKIHQRKHGTSKEGKKEVWSDSQGGHRGDVQVPRPLAEGSEEGTLAEVSGQRGNLSSIGNVGRVNYLIDNGESVQGKSATIDEQMAEGQQGESKEIHSSDENTDVAAANGTGEHVIETSATSLSGNAMSEWRPQPLQNDGRLEHKQGARPDDSMSRYYAWMGAAGIKLQNIIDQELGQILRQNPNAKVKFMAVRPQSNTTKDGDMKTHLMLVLDYDNSVNRGITSIHRTENGGVLESNGKKYLVIGTVGYGNRNADKLALYDILFSNNPRSTNGYGLVKRGQGEFFRTHPEERFYVPENLSTEVVPMSLIPGYIVKQLENDENPQFRSVRELLTDKERNPFGLTWNKLSWGIQEISQYMTVMSKEDSSKIVMVPRNSDANNGSAFVLIPASNGNMVPSYLKPLFYNEMQDGALKNKVIELLNNVTSPNYATRLQAVIDLSNIFYMDKDGNTILLMKSRSAMSLVRDGKPFRTFTLDENFDRQQFMEAFAEMNPRVNITKAVLQSNTLLQQYDEAGALQTDIALLSTAGSSYSIYGLDAQGNMLKPEVVNNDIPRTGNNSDFRNGGRTQVVFKHQYYNYDRNEGRYYLNGIPVIDEAMIRSLDYNRRVIEGGISPVETNGVWGTYILGSKEHPEAVQIHRNTKEVKEMSDAEALKVIEKMEQEAAEKERAEVAKAALEAIHVEDVALGEEEQGMVVDDETGELITPDELKQRQAERDAQFEEKRKKGGEGETPAQPQQQGDRLHKSGARLEFGGNQGATQNFNTLAKSKAWRRPVNEVIKTKWPDAPRNMAELEKFLREHHVEVDVIGTSDTDIQAWLKTIEDCR